MLLRVAVQRVVKIKDALKKIGSPVVLKSAVFRSFSFDF